MSLRTTAIETDWDADALERPRLGSRLEWALLGVMATFLTVNTASLIISKGVFDPLDVLPLGVWLFCALFGAWAIPRLLPQRDPLLFPLAMAMSGWGLLLIRRLAPPFGERQALWLLLATAALYACLLIPNIFRLLRAYRYTFLMIGLILLLATIFFGRNPSGREGAPALWIGIGSFFFQPSEPLKVILVVFLASYLAEQYPVLRLQEGGDTRRMLLTPRVLGPLLLMWAISIIFLIWQRDLGAAVLFFLVFTVLIYVASGSLLLLLTGAAFILVAAFAAYTLIDLVQLRVDIWINPWIDADGRAYQIVQSLMTFAEGRIFGQGFNTGLPTIVPVVHSDFIFAALAEEFGLIGTVTAIACIATFLVRGLRIAFGQEMRAFQILLVVGLSVLYGAQSLLIIGGVLKLIPLTGVTLPFFSYGGSSLIVSFVIVGLLMRLSSGER